MTRNKKKLRRLERLAARRSLRTLSLPSLALAGLLAASPAWAAPDYSQASGWTGVVTLGSTADLTLNTPWTEVNQANITASAIVLDGGRLKLVNSARLINFKLKGQEDGGASFTMNGGELTLEAGSGPAPHSALNMTSVTINDGTATLTGTGGSNWSYATLVGGYQGLVVNGGNVTLKENSELFGGGDAGAQFLGGTVTLLGNKSASGFDGDAAHIMFGGSGANTIGGTAVLAVGNGADKAYGVMTTGRTVDMKGGTLTVNENANLLLQPNTNANDGTTSLVYSGADTGTFNLSGGTLTVKAGGALSAFQTQINQSGGALTVNGTLYTDKPGVTDYAKSGFTMSGGSLSIGKDGSLQAGDLKITGGTITVGGTEAPSSSDWKALTSLGGYGTTSHVTEISGGTITLGQGGVLFAGAPDWTTPIAMHIGGDATIVMDGPNAVLYAASETDDIASSVALNIDGNAKIAVNAGKDGYLLSRNTTMSGGALDVQGTLTVAGNSAKGGTVADGLDNVTKGGTFVFKGGTLSVGSAGTLDFASGNVDLSVAGNGTVTADTLTVDGTAAGTGLSAQKLTLAGGTVNVKELNVVSGTNSLSMTGGSLVVAESFQNAASTVAVSGGVLSVDKSLVYDAAQPGLLKSGVNTINVSGNGVVEVRNGGEMAKADATTFHANLVGAGGLWTGVTVTGIDSTETTLADGKTANTVAATDAAIMSTEQLAQTTVATPMTATNEASLGSASGQVALVPNSQTLDGDVTLTTATSSTIVGQGEGSSLVIGAGEHQTNVTIANGAALNLGVASTQGGGVLNGSITNTSGQTSTLNVANGAFAVTGDVDLGQGDGGTLKLNENAALAVDGSVAADTLNLTGATLRADTAGTDVTFTEATVSQGGALVADTLLMDTTNSGGTLAIDGGSVQTRNLVVNPTNASISTITVGSAGGRGELVAETAVLSGATLFLDPVWSNGGTAAATNVAIDSFAGGVIDGNLGVGQNSMLALGTSDKTRLASAIDNSGLSWSAQGVTAALGIFVPQTLDSSYGIMVDGSLTTTPAFTGNQVEFAANSLLVVDGESLGGAPALRGDGSTTATVDVSSKLLLTNAATGESYAILSDFDAATPINGWADDNLLSSSYLQQLKGDNSVDGQWSVSVKHKSALSTLPGISAGMAGLVDSVYLSGLNDVDSPSAGVRFVTRATDRVYTPLSESARALESAAQTALAGGAPSVAFDAISAATNAVAERTGISVPSFSRQAGMAAGDAAGYSFGVWAMPLFRSTEIDGQKAGAFKYGVDSDLWGGAIGADVTNDNVRLGVALNVGGGDATSTGDLHTTKNDFDFWGATAYAGWRLNSFGLSGDLGYSSVSSDIKQDQPWNLGGRITSKVDADVYSAGLKAEYVIPTPYADITPSLGVRYSAYRQGRHNADNAWGTVFAMDKADMDTWTFPIGVKVSRDFTTTGWSIRPELNLAIIPAAGDTKLDSKASIPGLNLTPASLSGHVFDDWTGEAGLGLSVAKENVSFGLNYGFQGSENRASHSVFGTLRVAF